MDCYCVRCGNKIESVYFTYHLGKIENDNEVPSVEIKVHKVEDYAQVPEHFPHCWQTADCMNKPTPGYNPKTMFYSA